MLPHSPHSFGILWKKGRILHTAIFSSIGTISGKGMADSISDRWMLNIQSSKVWEFYRETLEKIASYGAAIVRLDAFAYAPKTPGKKLSQ